MSARHKLNGAYFNGILLIAGGAAALAESWLLFGLLVVALTATGLLTGDIRPAGRK